MVDRVKLYKRDRHFKMVLRESFKDMPSTTEDVYDVTIVATDSKTSGGNPRWRQQIASGRNAGTSFTGHREIVNNLNTRCGMSANYSPYIPSKWRYEFDYAGHLRNDVVPHNIPSDLLGLADNRALTEFVRKALAKQTTFEGGTFLGELPSLVRQLRSPAKSLRKGMGDYFKTLRKRSSRRPGRRRTRKQRAKQLSEMASSTWLEYSLGWRPVLHDINGALQTLVDYQYGTHLYQHHVVGFGEEEREVLLSPKSVDNKILYDASQRVKVLVKYIGGVGAGLDAPGALDNARKVGFAPSNWLPTAWELIPYSFVVDYFTNIGDIISASTMCRSNMLWAIKIVRTERRTDLINIRPNVTPPGGSGPISWHPALDWWSPGASSNVHIDYDRGNYNGSYVPDLEFSLPHSSTQWLNLAALAVGGRAIRKLWRL